MSIESGHLGQFTEQGVSGVAFLSQSFEKVLAINMKPRSHEEKEETLVGLIHAALGVEDCGGKYSVRQNHEEHSDHQTEQIGQHQFDHLVVLTELWVHSKSCK